MNILIVPKIYCRFKDQIEYSVEKKLLIFIKKIFPNSNIQIAFKKSIYKKTRLIIFSGGNNIISFSKKKEDIERNKIDNYFFKYGIKKKLPIFGICHGTQYLAKRFGCKFKKTKNHVGNHFVKIIDNQAKKYKQLVNSYHNIIITKKSKNIDILALCDDSSIEAFRHKKLNVGGIIWHPERFKKFKNRDINLIKKFYATGNFSFGKG